MVKVVFCLRRLPSLTLAEFLDYWRNVHGPLVQQHAEALGIRRYEQSHAMPSAAGTALGKVRGSAEPFDGIASLWFDDIEHIAPEHLTPAARSAAKELLEDEKRFIDLPRSPIWLVDDITVI
jgi:uncharacterized protein (TIGR02118 family)